MTVKRYAENCPECYGDGFRYKADYDVAEQNAERAGKDLFGYFGPRKRFWPKCPTCKGKGKLRFGRG
jgi:DnaJ-class molecular chaperone